MHHHHGTGSFDIAVKSRRFMLGQTFTAFVSYALLREARAAGTINRGRLSASRWIARQEELAQGLHTGSVSHLAWHDEVNRLAAEVDTAQLMAEAARGRNRDAGAPFMRDPVKRTIGFTPATAHAVTFDVIVDGLDAGQPDYLIQAVDPLGGRTGPDGTIIAPLLSFTESIDPLFGTYLKRSRARVTTERLQPPHYGQC